MFAAMQQLEFDRVLKLFSGYQPSPTPGSSFPFRESRGMRSRRRSMSSPLARDRGPLLYAPKWVRDDQRVQEVIKEIQELIKLEFRQPAPPAPVDGGVPRSLEPTVIPEVMPVPRRRPHVGMLLCFLLVVAAIAVPASKFPTEGIATAEERSNETPSFDSRFWEQDSKIAERPRPQSPQLSVNPGTRLNQGEARQLDREEIADLIGRGEKFIKAGERASARLVLQRAAEAGDQRAALMLAGTFDPIVLEKIGIQGFAPDIIRGFAPDIALARTWYELAKQFGSREAVRRLEMLVSRRDF